MYRLMALFVGTVIVSGAIGYAIGRRIDDERPAPVTPVVAVSATDTPTPVIGETPPPTSSTSDHIAAIESCLAGDGLVVDDAKAEETLACVHSRGFSGAALAVDGPEPAIVFGLQTVARPMAGQQLYIAWRRGGGWRAQILGDADTHTDWALLANTAAREASVSGRTAIVLLVETGVGGSAPEVAALLAMLEQEAWRFRWSSDETDITNLSHTNITFEGGGIERLLISGDSWLLQDDKSGIFHESNPGPHRFFDQVWELRQDHYEKVSESTQPSTYNTLVEFVYALRTGDNTAANWVTDPSLVDRAKEIGLDGYPGKEWMTDSDVADCCKPISILGDDLSPLVTFEFAAGPDGPLISQITGSLAP